MLTFFSISNLLQLTFVLTSFVRILGVFIGIISADGTLRIPSGGVTSYVTTAQPDACM